MAEPQENLMDWLRDAHAMEQQAEQMLKAQAARIEHYPQLKARIEQHLEETLGNSAWSSRVSSAWAVRRRSSRTRWARWPRSGRQWAA